MLEPTKRFSNRVDYYVRSRPKYPASLLKFFQTELALSPADEVADIGSGTGFLTELFVRNGNPTFAVEPNEPMRNAAETYLGEWPNFHSVDGTAEATTLTDASVRFITAGQAFHWFDVEKCAVEFCRILKPNGMIALVWNERVNNASPFMIGYEELIKKYRRADQTLGPRLFEDDGMDSIARFFGDSGYAVRKFENPQTLNEAGLLDRTVSSSYMPIPDDPGYSAMVGEVRKLFSANQQDQQVRIVHETQVFYGVPGSDRRA